MTYKKFLALMLCSLFTVGKSSALCCFSKKAVQQAEPAEDPDQRALNAVHYWVEEIKRLNSVVSRIVREPEERGRAQHCLRNAVKGIKREFEINYRINSNPSRGLKYGVLLA